MPYAVAFVEQIITTYHFRFLGNYLALLAIFSSN